MTPNKLAKLAAMRRLGFRPAGHHDGIDRHQRVRCGCGYRIPFYRIALAAEHRQHCAVAVEQPAAVELSQDEISLLCARYWGELADKPDDFDL